MTGVVTGVAAAPVAVPVVLPVVDVVVGDDGRFDLTVDGHPRQVPPEVLDAGRAALRRLLTSLAAELASPMRVVITEADGSRFTDILTPPPPTAAPTPAGATTGAPEDAVARPAMLPPRLAGDGFLPGEPVAIAVVVAQQTAGQDGCAGLRLPAALLDGLLDGRGAVLFGQTSGNLVVLTAVEDALPGAGAA